MSKIKSNDKRSKLVDAADRLIYEKTFHTTTLADIAKRASVPLGNVYYYFKTKEAIMDAIISKRLQTWRSLFNQWEQEPESKTRLQSLVRYTINQADDLTHHGCTIGSLCQELSKHGGNVASNAAKLMHDVLNWIEQQFKNLGQEKQAKQLAEHLLATLQGISLLTLTLKEPEQLERQGELLEKWLSSL